MPDAQIPCVQISLVNSLDAKAHIAIGEALRELRDDNILFIGSGFSFHNLPAFFSNNRSTDSKNEQF
jgi:aromatic ring-opening dioxygenase catalytic subunit (LigB family)